MTVHSPLSKQVYLKALKERMESPFRFGSERFCGISPFGLLYVTHHCAHEWNRRITGERNTAIGIVQKDGDGCRIRFFVVKGLLAPHYLLSMFFFCLLCCVIVLIRDGVDAAVVPYILPISLAVAVLTGLGTAIAESYTAESAEGKRILHSILLDPTDLFSYMNNKNKL
jgi:hypothetical protein